MSKKDNLFELIRSLDKSEKRYFKLYFSGNKDEQKYIQLYNAIEKMDTYDEKKIKKNLKDAYIIKYFAETKYYLYQLLLKVLKNYRTENSIDNILLDKIQNVEILIQKALWEQAINELQKAKKMAYEYERYDFLTILFSYQTKIISSTRLNAVNNIDLQKLFIERNDASIKWTQTQDARHKVLQLIEVRNRIGYIKTKDDKNFYVQLKNEIENILKNADCAIAKVYSTESLVFYYNHIGNKKEENIYCKKLIELHSQNPNINASNPYQLASAIHNLCISEINLLNFDNAIFWIKRQETYLEIIQNDAEIKYKVEWSLASLQSYFYNVSGRFSEGNIVASKIIKWIETTEQLDNTSKWRFIGNCAEIYFSVKNYKQFFYCIHQIQAYWNNIDSNYKINYILLQMLAHIDEKNSESAIYSYNFLEKEINTIRDKKPTLTEKILLSFFKQLKENTYNNNLTNLIKKTYSLLLENENEIQTGEFEYTLWFEQMLSKNSFENLVRQKRKLQQVESEKDWTENINIELDFASFKKCLPKRIR